MKIETKAVVAEALPAKRQPKPWTVVEERRAEVLYKTMSAREVAGLGGEAECGMEVFCL